MEEMKETRPLFAGDMTSQQRQAAEDVTDAELLKLVKTVDARLDLIVDGNGVSKALMLAAMVSPRTVFSGAALGYLALVKMVLAGIPVKGHTHEELVMEGLEMQRKALHREVDKALERAKQDAKERIEEIEKRKEKGA